MGMYGTARIKPFQVRPPKGTTGSAAPPMQGPLPMGQTSQMAPNPTNGAQMAQPNYQPQMGPIQQTQYAQAPGNGGMGGSKWGAQVADSNGVVAGQGQANAVDQARMNQPQPAPFDPRDPRNAALAGYMNG